jgi:hypothetical protein
MSTYHEDPYYALLSSLLSLPLSQIRIFPSARFSQTPSIFVGRSVKDQALYPHKTLGNL